MHEISVTLYLLQKLRDYILFLSPSPSSSSSPTPGNSFDLTLWTTNKVCSLLIKPWTASSQSSFQQMMKDSHQFSSHHDLSLTYDEAFSSCPPQYFISHAWQYNYLEVVESLELHFLKTHSTNYNSKEIYLWFDLFLNDQWNAPNLTFEWWSTTFLSAVGNIGNTILLLFPWEDPIPLRRAWCLWEIHCTRITNSNFQILLSSKQEQSLCETLRSNFNEIMKNLCQINVEESESFLLQDKERIFEAIRSTEGGFSAINRDISLLIRDWLRSTAKYLLFDQEITSNSSPEDIRQILSDKWFYGKVLYEQGRFTEATECHRLVSSQQSNWLGSRHIETLKTLQSLSTSLTMLERYDEAIELCEQLIEGYSSQKPISLAKLLSVYSNKAAILKNIGKPHEALQLLKQSLDLAEQETAAACPIDSDITSITLSILFNIGMILSTFGNYDEAQEYFLRTITGKEAMFGSHHPEVLNSKRALAGMLSKVERYDEATLLFESILPHFEKSLGWEHLDTLAVAKNLALCYWIHENNHLKSLERFETCLRYLNLVLGEDNELSLQCRENIGCIYWEMKQLTKSSDLLERVYEARLILNGWNDHLFDISCWLIDIYREAGELHKILITTQRLYEKLIEYSGSAAHKTHLIQYNLGVAYYDVGNKEMALQHWNEILTSNSVNDELTTAVQNLMATINQSPAVVLGDP